MLLESSGLSGRLNLTNYMSEPQEKCQGPPDYARPIVDAEGLVGHELVQPPFGRNCYLCGNRFPWESKVNWRGHWICPGCFEKEKGITPELEKVLLSSPPGPA